MWPAISRGMGSDVGRAVLNTTLGIGGLFDVAGYMGMEYEPEDFGQTMAVWGLSEGPYIVIPVLGPSNVRDASGRLVDGYVDPVGRYLINTDREDLYYTRAGVSLVSQREEVLDLLVQVILGIETNHPKIVKLIIMLKNLVYSW